MPTHQLRKMVPLSRPLAYCVGLAFAFVNIQPVWAQPLHTRVFTGGGTLQSNLKAQAAQLEAALVSIDRVCHLSPAQRKKLDLAGRGDIKRFRDQYLSLEAQLADQAKLNDSFQFSQEIEKLRMKAQSGQFHEQSLLGRAALGTLTHDQLERYIVMVRESHHVATEAAIAEFEKYMIDMSKEWPKANNEKFQNFLRSRLKPVRNSGPYGIGCLIVQLGRLDPDEYKPLITDAQWSLIEPSIRAWTPRTPSLREAGYMEPAEELN